MLFLHLKSGHVYEYVGLTIIEATMEPAVIYCSPGCRSFPPPPR